MTLELPRPVPLDLPDEDPTALEELATAVTGGAFHLGLLGVHLTGPAASVRDWVGRDASTAAAQVDALAVLVRAERDAVTSAAERVEAHAGLVRDAVVRVRALQAAQREEFGAAVHRLSVLVGGPVDPFPAPLPEAVAVVEEFRAAEGRRAGAHAALLCELAEDAAATARVLAGCTAVVGGTGAPGDDGRVLRHMALTLPGWGDQELAARGAAFGRLLASGFHPDDWVAQARQVAVLADAHAFADAVLGVLGAEGLRRLLQYVGSGGALPGGPLAAVLAAVVGGAGNAPGGRGRDVLRTRLVESDDPSERADLAAVGMGELLSLAARQAGGVPTWLVADWGRQILAREATLLGRAPEDAQSAGRVGAVWSGGAPDPVREVVRLLVESSDRAAAADLLSSSEAWTALLSRSWQDAGDEVSRLITLSGQQGGELGRSAVLAGLEGLGWGLHHGDASRWEINRTTVTLVAPALASAFLEHAGVVVDVLRSGGAATATWEQAAALGGLGYLTLVPGVASGLDAALRAWAAGAPVDLRSSSSDLAGRGAVVGAYVAVRQYGQRLAYALHGFDAQAEALERARIADTIGLLVSHIAKVGSALGNLEPFVAHWVGADGTWHNGPDRGVVLTGEDAGVIALGTVRVATVPEGRAVLEEAGRSFEVVTDRLGVPAPPTSPRFSYVRTALQELADSLPGLPDPEDREGPKKPFLVKVAAGVR